jgi:hypothetical protein
MNQRPKSPSEIYQEALNKATAEKPLSERMEESDKKGPLIDFLITTEIDLARRPERKQ